jgi:hypothetical protein
VCVEPALCARQRWRPFGASRKGAAFDAGPIGLRTNVPTLWIERVERPAGRDQMVVKRKLKLQQRNGRAEVVAIRSNSSFDSMSCIPDAPRRQVRATIAAGATIGS